MPRHANWSDSLLATGASIVGFHKPQRFTFHVEHVRAKQHHGGDETENLALACPYRNRFKGPNLSAIDPETGTLVPIFNPRTQTWQEHFAYMGGEIVGRTAVGRATVILLNMNEEPRLEIRIELLRNGER